MTTGYAPSAVGVADQGAGRQFRLPTLATETVDRFSDHTPTPCQPSGAGFQADPESRQAEERPSCPPARPGTPSYERAPVLRQQLVRLAEGDFVDRGLLAFAGHRQDARYVRHRTQADAVHPGVQARAGYGRPSETFCRGCSGSSTTSTCWSGRAIRRVQRSRRCNSRRYERRSIT